MKPRHFTVEGLYPRDQTSHLPTLASPGNNKAKTNKEKREIPSLHSAIPGADRSSAWHHFQEKTKIQFKYSHFKTLTFSFSKALLRGPTEKLETLGTMPWQGRIPLGPGSAAEGVTPCQPAAQWHSVLSLQYLQILSAYCWFPLQFCSWLFLCPVSKIPRGLILQTAS